jgi:gliding motility-associated-like protein
MYLSLLFLMTAMVICNRASAKKGGRLFVVPAGPSATISVSNQPQCTGHDVNFTVNVTGVHQYTLVWYVNGKLADSSNHSFFTTTTLLNGDQVYCQVKPLSLSIPAFFTNVITVVMLPSASPAVVISPDGPLNTCAGDTLKFTAQISDGGASPAIQWFRNGIQLNDTGLTYTANDFTDGDSIVCTLSNTTECTYYNPATSNRVIVHVASKAPLAMSIAPEAEPPFCQGGQITFIASANAPKQDLSYQWYVNGQKAGSNSYEYTAAFNNGDVVTCQATGISASGCYTLSGGLSNAYTVQLIQQAPPAMQITQVTTGVCPGSPVTFSAIASNRGNAPAYQWQVNGINAGSDQPDFTSDALKNGDKITCILTGGQVCKVPVTSNVVDAAINASPVVTFANTDVHVIPGSGISLSPQISGNITTYSWTPTTGLNDAAIANPVASPTVTTQYTLQVTTTDGCQGSGSITVDVFKQIVVPNTFTPNGDGINDTWDIKGLDYFPGSTVEVYNRAGALIFHSNGYPVPWDGKFQGKMLPVDTYYYIIDPKNGKPKLSGYIAIIK